MAVSYTCPNPDCRATLKSPNRIQAGKSVKCPKCTQQFVPETDGVLEEDHAETFKLADEPNETKKPVKPGAKAAAKAEPPKPEPYKKPDDDDEDAESIKKGYGVIKESEDEIKEAEKNKPKFTEVQDKFKKSARGPAQSLMVIPSQLLTFEGLITMALGVGTFVVAMWPLVFNDAPPDDDEVEDAVMGMAIGLFSFVWGAAVCYGASEMHELGSYTWSMVGAVMGVLPILVGIFAIVMLQNPKVKAGFEEGEAGPDEEDEDEEKEEDEDEEDEDEEDEDEEDEDEEDEPRKKKRAKSKKRDDDEEDEDEKPKKKRKRASRDDDEDD